MMNDISLFWQGLLQAVRQVLPEAEHRFCARHIYANWGKKWTGIKLKELFWACAWSTFEEQFKDNLQAIKEENEDASKAMMTYPVKSWVRAYFSNRCHSQMVDNNMAESLNKWIDDYRYLPVIRMFDGIREKLMDKWASSEIRARKWKGNFSPHCMSFFEIHRGLATRCQVRYNGDAGYEVREGQNRHTVSIQAKICTCRFWELTGIPCQHSIAAMWHARVDPMTHISDYYSKETYLDTYRTKFGVVRGREFWDIEECAPVLPPPITKLPGRPKLKRRRTEEVQRRIHVALYPVRQDGAPEGALLSGLAGREGQLNAPFAGKKVITEQLAKR